MENVYDFDVGSIYFSCDWNTQKKLRSIKNTGNNLPIQQMFDISEKLVVGQSDEIYGVTPINWSDPSWKYLSSIGDEQVIALHQKYRKGSHNETVFDISEKLISEQSDEIYG